MSRNKKMLFVNPWNGIVGPNVGMQQLAHKALERGHAVHVAVLRRDKFTDQLESKGVVCHPFDTMELTPRTKNPFAILRHLWRAWPLSSKLGLLAREMSADVICVNGENMLVAPRAGKLAHCPTAVIIRGARFMDLGQIGRVFLAIQGRWVTRYIGVSQTVCHGLREMGVPDEKIETVFNGVDTDVFAPSQRDPALMAELGICPEAKVIGAVCHLVPRKGVHHLVEVFAHLAERIPEAICVVVGKARDAREGYVSAIYQRIESLSLQKRILFVGEQTDIPRFMNLMDVIVHPSETESFGRTIAEGMACGKPVVGFRVSAVGELIVEGQTGRLIEPFDTQAMADVVMDLLADKPRCEKLGLAGRQRARSLYDLHTNVAQLIDLLEHLAYE